MPPAPLIDGRGLCHRGVRVRDQDVVFLRAILEGYDGLAAVHGDGDGSVTVTTTCSRAGELDSLLNALSGELGLQLLNEQRPSHA